MGKLKIGCVADDFTGASDWASFFREEGIQPVLYNGVPDQELAEGCPVAVIALKTRTAPVDEAVRESLRALKWLKDQGSEQIYLKYCSTFDCQREGNIGPVADAFMEGLHVPYTILCPALPVNGRTVRDGRLYIHGVPLEKSTMKDHPLTPMWDSQIASLMREQTKYPVYPLGAERYEGSGEALQLSMEEIAAQTQGGRCYFVPDYYLDGHGEDIVRLLGSLRLLTGGSGISRALAQKLKMEGAAIASQSGGRRKKDKGLLLAGSCSAATLEQIDRYRQGGGVSIKISPEKLLEGKETAEGLWRQIRDCKEGHLLVYSSDSPQAVRRNQECGQERVAKLLEDTMAYLAVRAVEQGRRRIIVAGGETSGAVGKALGYKAYFIGKSIAPGVPVLIPLDDPRVRLVMKSGNFGDSDFFEKALKITEEE